MVHPPFDFTAECELPPTADTVDDTAVDETDQDLSVHSSSSIPDFDTSAEPQMAAVIVFQFISSFSYVLKRG